MQIRPDHYHLSTIQTVGDVLHRAADISRDTEKYGNLTRPMLLELLTEVAYPHGNVGANIFGIRADPQYAEHLRISGMDVEVQTFLKAHGGDNLFKNARHDRQLAGDICLAAAVAWDNEHRVV